jgi:acetoin utilization protein AcuB
MTKTTIRHYMTPTPHTIGAEQMLTVAIELMRENKIRHLPVLRGGRLVGILSERDVALISGLPAVDPAAVPVEDAMSEEVYTVSGDTPLDEVAATMAANKYGSALVVDPRNHLVGVFTTIDALHALADGAPTRKHAAAH